jgi:hypothetical protein
MIHNRNYYTLALLVLLFCRCNTQDKKVVEIKSPENIQSIKDVFNRWLLDKTREGVFYGADSCNINFIIDHNITTMPLMIPGDYNTTFQYSDINNDKKTDGLVTFVADLCDGGNGAMWTQYQVLILSSDTGYYSNDSFFDTLGNNFEGIIHVDSVYSNKIFGTLIEFKNGDGHCCPSVREPFTVVYEKPVINFVNQQFKPTKY